MRDEQQYIDAIKSASEQCERDRIRYECFAAANTYGLDEEGKIKLAAAYEASVAQYSKSREWLRKLLDVYADLR